ncbi:MAG: FG-GAP repeat protein [Alphaproteobacteria bacterium]|nr:FG-GAP repeat protein [Alphaproteobacteria bacterium]MCB9796615.1 FG-GAP repeat protein [Alphaproteobacteria bacterium]
MTLLLLLACSGPAETPKDRTLNFDTTVPELDSEPTVVLNSCRADGASLGPDTCITEAPCAWSGEHAYAYFGADVAIGGDLDGDGVADLLFGAPGYEPGRGTEDAINDAGRASVVSGASLLEGEAPRVVGELVGGAALGWVGSSVSIPGDVNGDGIADLWVGAMGASANGVAYAGQLHLVLGQEGGWTEPMVPRVSILGDAEYARLGFLVRPAGDVDGDGLADTWATAHHKRFDGDSERSDSGTVYLFKGREQGWTANLSDADATVTGAGSSDELGRAMAAGDFDGDGHPDLAAAAPYASGKRGTVHLLPGGPEAFTSGMSAGDAPASISGVASYDYVGYDVAVGDFNGDGVDDLAVGVPLTDEGGDGSGAVWIYAGAADFFAATPPRLGSVVGEQEAGQLGTGVMAGDVDGDGFDDLGLGAVLTWRGLVTKGGRVYLLRGREDGWPQGESVSSLGERVYGATVNDYLGDEGVMGDVDGDGKAELLLSTSYADVSGTHDMGGAWLFWGE